jgi:asparagine synthase (glutamine-hydrolysing)
MCGILGSINLPFDEEVLDLISHRGPDDSGIVSLCIGRHRLTLGHRRLAILDLSSAGHQPMQTLCGKYSIVYNGEIYNYLDLRQGIKGVELRGHSDTETILNFIAQRGIDAAQEFNGIFAFGLVDAVKGRLFLVRDPFGIKPLYYFKQGRSFIFSSEIKPILKLVKDSIDPTNMAELLRLRYTPSPDTLFKNIKKVRPGHIVELSLFDEGLSCREYPFLETPPARTDMSFEEARDRYGTLFEGAIRKQLMSDVEVGVLLSGGIDSALVAKFAQKHTSYRMRAFTVGFTDQDEADEIADARETAFFIGMEHYETRISFEDFLATIHKCITIVEEPLATTSIIPMFYLSELVSQELKVVLSGQGADESLGGYGRYQGELYKEVIPPVLASFMKALAKIVGVRNDQVLRGLKSLSEKNDLDRFLSFYSVFDEDEIRRLTGARDNRSSERLRYFFDLLQCEDLAKSVERMMSLDLRMNLADDLLLYTDKITMHFSIECRVPMLDLDLVRFIESLPYYYRIKLWQGKIIHKHFARRVLPDSIIKRKKKGFISPTRTWFRRGAILREILLDPTSRFSSFFDLREVDKVIQGQENGFNRERHIFLLIGLYYWMAEYL